MEKRARSAVRWVEKIHLSLAFLLVPISLVAGTRPPEEQRKIDWLLSDVQHAEAIFIRNGKPYNGERAAAHLKAKLFFAGQRVQTARQFVVAVASRSEQSGKPYEICLKDGSQEPLQKWLLERLAVYEKELDKPPKP